MRWFLILLLATLAAHAGEPDLAAWVDGADAPELAQVELPTLLRAARAFAPGEPYERGRQTHRVELRVGKTRRQSSITTYVPAGVDSAKPAPALLYLHGSGGNGQEALGLWQATADALGMIVIAPTEAGENAGYAFTADERHAALAALRWARRRFNLDENRIHLSGVSRGGHMTWDLGARHPDRWASLSPMIGGPRWLPQRGQNNIRFLENIAHLPMRDLQGEKDQAGLLLNLRYAFSKLKRLNAKDAQFITFPELGHTFRSEAVDWPKFLAGAERNSAPPRVVLLCTQPRRAAWLEVLAIKSNVKEKFTPKVDGRRWPALDAMGQRAYMDELVAERTARIEARWLAKGKFEVKSNNVKKFRLLLAPGMFDANEPVVVTWNGRARKKKVKPSTRVLLDDFANRFDRTFIPIAELRIP
ncbi:MAG: carboxylesterase family protein [Planctomycetota bacterium]|jgi:pimeloyl-ACP methyl ester carboxylesterase